MTAVSQALQLDRDTIVAVATPPGRGGIGIVRASGPNAVAIATTMTGIKPSPRYAHFCSFVDSDQRFIDEGLVIYFAAPHSFTGEDVVELHAHGNPVVLDLLVNCCLALGARIARAGEFSERAFLNGRIDLIQAEAIADLIGATTAHAARNATRSLQGVFSAQVNQLVSDVIALRMYVEASIDFPDDDIDRLDDVKIAAQILALLFHVDELLSKTRQGIIIKDGLHIVIIGRPNAGKSSLLNALTGVDTAIVSTTAGTTRDVLRADIQIDGIPVRMVDTAGVHNTDNNVEIEGIRRALAESKIADIIIIVVDSTDEKNKPITLHDIGIDVKNPDQHIVVVKNKADLAGFDCVDNGDSIFLSAKTGAGLELLRAKIKNLANNSPTEQGFTARQRHLEKINKAKAFLLCAQNNNISQQGRELLAEDLRLVQQALSEITGAFTSDGLLGEIFSSFCIGK